MEPTFNAEQRIWPASRRAYTCVSPDCGGELEQAYFADRYRWKDLRWRAHCPTDRPRSCPHRGGRSFSLVCFCFLWSEAAFALAVEFGEVASSEGRIVVDVLDSAVSIGDPANYTCLKNTHVLVLHRFPVRSTCMPAMRKAGFVAPCR